MSSLHTVSTCVLIRRVYDVQTFLGLSSPKSVRFSNFRESMVEFEVKRSLSVYNTFKRALYG